jgi:hypothetical protein
VQPEVRAQRVGVPAAQPADGPDARVEPGQPVERSAPQHVEEHGLGEVVGRVAEQRAVGQRAGAGGAGAGLEVGTRRHRHPLGPEGGAEALRGGRHHVGLPIGAGPEPVVDVHRGDLETGLAGQGEQREGIGSARHRAGHRGPGRREVAPPEQLGQLAHHRGVR